MDSPPDGWVRVLLFGNIRECMVGAANGFTASDSSGRAEAYFGRVGEGICVQAANGRIMVGSHLFEGEVLISPEQPFYFSLDGKFYRGNLRLSPNKGGNSLQAINHLPIEAYLLGVVGAEMPSYWEPQALMAQAVAARTYVLSMKIRFGRGRCWDVNRTEAYQVYEGMSAETATVRAAVEETAGKVLAVRENGQDWQLLPSYYGSVCGGHTENSFAVFGDRFSPLCGVSCPYCQPIAKAGLWNWEPQVYSLEQINHRLLERYPSLGQLERIAGIEPTRFGAIGRITGVKIIGSNGKTDFLRGEDFRLALDPSGRKLKSAVFQIRPNGQNYEFSQGRGFGHGVGMCQTGAEYLARQRWEYDRILSYYYPGARLIRIDYEEQDRKL